MLSLKHLCVLLLVLAIGLAGNAQQWAASSATDTLVINRAAYADRLEGFWLGACIANWTGLVTEMDKIGNIGEIRTGDFYTRADWGQPDHPSIFNPDSPSDLSPTIDFVFRGPDSIWGADDDTDIEYMYQYLLAESPTPLLTPEQIRKGWLRHIRTGEENYLWVSNQKALDLMQEGVLPPQTSAPNLNEHWEMIDAQLTTEIFGLFAPGRPDVALRLAHLPIRTTARSQAAHIAEFYVVMHALAPLADTSRPKGEVVFGMAEAARSHLTDSGYAGKMYDFVKSKFDSGIPWEQTRDSIYQRYQVDELDGYHITSQNLYCNGCFAAGVNFAASLVSLFYGKGDFKETIKIGTLCGWDSDNPTATWGGLLGFLSGKKQIEALFGRKFSDRFNIHRTRQNFPRDGIDTFPNMAQTGLGIIDRVVPELMQGHQDAGGNNWHIPLGEFPGMPKRKTD